MINQVILLGYLNTDPDVRYLNGRPYMQLLVRLVETYTLDGTRRSRARLVSVKVFDERYIRLAERTKKGRLVYLMGRLSWRARRTSEGQAYSTAEITVPKGGLVKFMDPPPSAFVEPGELGEIEDSDEEGEDGQG